MAPKIAIVFYTLAEAEKKGIEAAGGTADLYQIPETLNDEILGKMYIPSTRRSTVLLTRLLHQGALWGKYAGLFVGSGGQGGGQESTAIATLSTLTHHGLIYVPLGFKTTSALQSEINEVRGGSAWGAGTFAGADGSRQPSAKEIELATEQGKAFYGAVSKVNFA
ncbi:hypothetical protein FH972_026632 [Carpinus fangiana]|uniref:Flavodoxin-like domain-containing protein n=1 Tax=Carpinus fangiana TaxID=176857 RepID=A0A5N6L4N5_9ROSI|nr:hypothetical protein FH972_026632 [Carpinus fangiana]